MPSPTQDGCVCPVMMKSTCLLRQQVPESLANRKLARTLAPYQGKPSPIPGGFSPGFSHVTVLADDVAGCRVFSGISRPLPPFQTFRRCSISALLYPHRLSIHNIKNTLTDFSSSCLTLELLCTASGTLVSYETVKRAPRYVYLRKETTTQLGMVRYSKVTTPEVDPALREHRTPVPSPARRGDGALVARAVVTLVASSLLDNQAFDVAFSRVPRPLTSALSRHCMPGEEATPCDAGRRLNVIRCLVHTASSPVPLSHYPAALSPSPPVTHALLISPPNLSLTTPDYRWRDLGQRRELKDVHTRDLGLGSSGCRSQQPLELERAASARYLAAPILYPSHLAKHMWLWPIYGLESDAKTCRHAPGTIAGCEVAPLTSYTLLITGPGMYISANTRKSKTPILTNDCISNGRSMYYFTAIKGPTDGYPCFHQQYVQVISASDGITSGIRAAANNEMMRVMKVTMEQRWIEGVGETGDPRENPPTSGIRWNNSQMQKSGCAVSPLPLARSVLAPGQVRAGRLVTEEMDRSGRPRPSNTINF
ncbi:hypothetical protein PR048_026907 [Dryococelus australis]|uniref:Uncharacterized protein n=1 Tax=Dryococelus australis TaxID=614101 RepID=A0ABQ9GMM5_9NEOP|nr:hypothetical protein PR048_026907 [Dryococelus australis]